MTSSNPLSASPVPTAAGACIVPANAPAAPLYDAKARNQSGGTGASKSATYSYRLDDCPDCDWPLTSCGECDRGDVNRHCILCGEYRPLNDEDECERCVDGYSLTCAEFDAKYRPMGWEAAELAALRKDAA